MDYRTSKEKAEYRREKSALAKQNVILSYNSEYEEYKVYPKGKPQASYHDSDLWSAVQTGNSMAEHMQRKPNPSILSHIKKIIPVDAIIQTTDGKIHALRTKNPGRTKNVAMGYMAGGVFHPIRASADYDESRVGESRAGGRKKKAKKVTKKATKRTAAKRPTSKKKAKKKPARKAIRTSRATYWGD